MLMSTVFIICIEFNYHLTYKVVSLLLYRHMVELICEVRVCFLDEVFEFRLVDEVKLSHLFFIVPVFEVGVAV